MSAQCIVILWIESWFDIVVFTIHIAGLSVFGFDEYNNAVEKPLYSKNHIFYYALCGRVRGKYQLSTPTSFSKFFGKFSCFSPLLLYFFCTLTRKLDIEERAARKVINFQLIRSSEKRSSGQEGRKEKVEKGFGRNWNSEQACAIQPFEIDFFWFIEKATEPLSIFCQALPSWNLCSCVYKNAKW